MKPGQELLGTVKDAAKFFFGNEKDEMSLAKIFEFIRNVDDRRNMALPSYVRKATVDSRVFVSKEAAMEEVINDVLYANHALYVGWIASALSMTQYVGNTRVREIISTVATESLNKYNRYTNPSIDSILNSYTVDKRKLPTVYAYDEGNPISIIETQDSDTPDIRGSQGMKGFDMPSSFNLLGGTIIEMSFAVGEKQKITIPVLVRLSPTLITDNVAKQFFKSNYKPDMWLRWFKVRSGEISFWRDFLLELDLRDEKKQALKEDKSGVLFDMFAQQKSALTAYIGKILGWRSERQNIASSIHVYTKPQFSKWCHDVGCRFDSESDRNTFFKKTFSTCVNVIDSDFNKVYVYAAGIKHSAEYSFSQLQNNRNKQQYDLASIMRAFSSQSTPRF